jgi:hypothetical protein
MRPCRPASKQPPSPAPAAAPGTRAPQVYKGLWRGTVVAVKTMILPANMSGAEKREKMAVMEAAISSSLSHPNVVQVRAARRAPSRALAGRSARRARLGAPRLRTQLARSHTPPPCRASPPPQTYTYAIRPLREAATGSGESLPDAPPGAARKWVHPAGLPRAHTERQAAGARWGSFLVSWNLSQTSASATPRLISPARRVRLPPPFPASPQRRHQRLNAVAAVGAALE